MTKEFGRSYFTENHFKFLPILVQVFRSLSDRIQNICANLKLSFWLYHDMEVSVSFALFAIFQILHLVYHLQESFGTYCLYLSLWVQVDAENLGNSGFHQIIHYRV